MKSTVVVLNDLRSLYNVGAICRSAEGLGVDQLLCCGSTPYLVSSQDSRPPYVRDRARKEIHKTALGAEESLPPTHAADLNEVIANFRQKQYGIYAIEQATTSQPINQVQFAEKSLLILGSETSGLTDDILELVDQIVEIPMPGKKESLNVASAAAIAIYQLQLRP